MALDGLRDDLKAAAPPTPEPVGVRFAEMMKDRASEDSSHYARWVETTGSDPDLAKRFASGSMQSGDMQQLETLYESFEKRKANVMEVVGQMSPELIAKYSEGVPLLKTAIHLKSADAVSSVFKDHLTRLAFEEPAEFEKLEQATTDLKAFREGTYKARDEVINAELKDLGITESRWREIMKLPNEADRVKQFSQEVRDTFWFFGPKDWRKRAEALGAKAEKDDLVKLVGELDNFEKGVGDALALLADDNATVRKALNQELLGTREKPEKLMNMMDGADTMKNFEKRFNIDAERERFRNARGYAGASAPDKVIIDRDFKTYAEQEARKAMKGKGGGKWLEIFLAFFTGKL